MEDLVSGSIMIYGLKDPRDEKIRYVGKTQQSLLQRLQGHSQETWKRIREKNSTPKHEWIFELGLLGFEPEIEVLEECSSDDWEIRERAWITLLPDLLNLTEGGGNGTIGYKHSEETKVKMSTVLKGRSFSEETREKMSASALKKPPVSEETKAKISASLLGRPKSEESKAKMSASKLGKVRGPHSEETKVKMRASALKRPSRFCPVCKAEGRSSGMKKGIRHVHELEVGDPFFFEGDEEEQNLFILESKGAGFGSCDVRPLRKGMARKNITGAASVVLAEKTRIPSPENLPPAPEKVDPYADLGSFEEEESPKVKVKKPKGGVVAPFVKELIRKGATDEDIVAQVRENFPNYNAWKICARVYRKQLEG